MINAAPPAEGGGRARAPGEGGEERRSAGARATVEGARPRRQAALDAEAAIAVELAADDWGKGPATSSAADLAAWQAKLEVRFGSRSSKQPVPVAVTVEPGEITWSNWTWTYNNMVNSMPRASRSS